MKKRISPSLAEIEEDFKGDLWGQVLTTQQRVEALSARLGAAERRISAEMGECGDAPPDACKITGGELDELHHRISLIEKSSVNLKLKGEVKKLSGELQALVENQEKNESGGGSPVFQWSTYRVVEISGAVTGVTAVIAAILLATDNIGLLKNPMFPLVMGISLLSVAIFGWMRKKENEDLDVIYIP